MVVLTGQSMGQVFKLDEEGTVIGRADDCEVPLADEGISRVHCILLFDEGRWMVKDMKSTNGTFVGERIVGAVPLALEEGQRIRLGLDVLLRFGRQDAIERQFLDHLYRAATRDALTGLTNRRLFRERLESEVTWHARHDEKLSLLFVDIDHFKKINDTFGHSGGDEVLVGVSRLLEEGTRSEDIVARYGGEEFVVLLRQTGADLLDQIAERFRRTVEAASFDLGGMPIRVTVSIGCVTRRGEELTDATELLHEADSALYEAKERGRNQTVSASVR